jgi:hypothetical protein
MVETESIAHQPYNNIQKGSQVMNFCCLSGDEGRRAQLIRFSFNVCRTLSHALLQIIDQFA